MPLEYEYVFRDYDKKKVIMDMKEIGAIKKGHYIFRIIILNHPLNTSDTYIRIRDEGHRITLTYKYKEEKSEFSDEYEINIDNFDTALNILYGLGCTKKYYYEKMREIWEYKNTEFVFDVTPGVPERMEIESKTKKELDSITKKINMINYKYDSQKNNIIMDLYGFTIPKDIDLTFNNCKKQIGKYVIKNKNIFNKTIREQLELYNKLKKNENKL
jgi:predicted adenylyl cyclase CyaB